MGLLAKQSKIMDVLDLSKIKNGDTKGKKAVRIPGSRN